MNDGIKKYNRHSIRDLSLEKRKKKVVRREGANLRQRPKKSKSSLYFWIFSVATLFFVASLFYTYFTETKVKIEIINPKLEEVTLDSDFIHVAYKNPEESQLGYNVYKINQEVSETLIANGKQYVEEKAKGTLTVYNNFSSNPQRIIKNTRFESPDGKIYRVRKAFTIPGRKKLSNGKYEPGSIDIVVYADDPGSSYNTDKGTHFTLPGLKNDSKRYKNIYAVAKTDITGGFKGEKYTVSKEQEQKATSLLKEKLLSAIKLAVKKKVRKDEIYFDDSIFVNFGEVKRESLGSNSVKITLPATAYVLSFNKFDFAREVLSSSSALLDFDNGKVYIKNISDIKFKIHDKENVDVENDDIIKFTVSGIAKAAYWLDKEELKQALAGKDYRFLNMIKEAYPIIDKAEDVKISFAPAWRTRFPENTDNIEIVERYEN